MGMSGHASGESVVAVSIATTVLAALGVSSRLFTRLGMQGNGGLDDVFIGFALLFSIALTITIGLQVKYGMGQHQDALSEADQVAQLKPFWASIWIYNLALSSTKFSILLQYLRIFPQKSFRWSCNAMIAIVSVYTAWTFFSAIFACTPVEYFWKPNLPGGGKCLNRFAVWFANAGINIATDVGTGILPLPVLKSLQLPRRQKIIVMCVFGLGGFTCVVSALRLQSLYVISRATDVSWENPLAAIWSVVEVNTAIMCSCIPTLKACVARVFPRFFRSNNSYALSGDRSNRDRGRVTDRSRVPDSEGPRSKMSFDALGRGLTGHGQPMQKTYIRSRTDASSDDIDLDPLGNGSPPKDKLGMEDGIQVVTVVEQAIERRETRDPERIGSDSGSTKHLVSGTFYEHN